MGKIARIEGLGCVETVDGDWTRLGGVDEGGRRGVERREGKPKLAGAHSPVNCAKLNNGRDLNVI